MASSASAEFGLAFLEAGAVGGVGGEDEEDTAVSQPVGQICKFVLR